MDEAGAALDRLEPAAVATYAEAGGWGRAIALESRPDLERVLLDWRPDVIHAGPIQSCGFMAALASSRPLMVMSWGSDLLVDADRDDLSRWITTFTLRSADRLLCDCEAVRQKANEFASFLPDRVVQFPWGVDLQAFAPAVDKMAVRRRLGVDAGFVVLSTRLWEDFYGVETVLEAVHRARQQAAREDVRLVMLGDGSRATHVRQFLASRGLDTVVHTPGLVPHDRLPEYFQAADLYLSCAKSDGSSISLLEAMASGLPVVVTDSPSNREWVEGLPCGWRAGEGDADSFASGIAHFASLGPDGRREAGERNRQVAAARANWSTNVDLLLDAYENLHRAR